MVKSKVSTKNTAAKLTKAQYAKVWYALNKERAKATGKAWYSANRARVSAKNVAWLKIHPGYKAAATAKWRKAHYEAATDATTAWWAAHPDYAQTVAGPKRLKKLTVQLEKMAKRKKPKRCDVCKKTGRRICFDHCHKSDKFRGWICHQCNTTLSHTDDSPKLLRKLADYLEAAKKAGKIRIRHNPALKTRKEKLAGRKKPKRCDVCKKSKWRICFDHNHKTGVFRGWLCHHCNVAIGLASDSPKLLRKLADYLELTKGKK